MKLRSLKDIFSTSICINPGTTKIEEPKVTADSSIYDFLPDQIGQGADRLFYAGGRVIVLPSEEYGKALQIAEQMDNIIGQDKRLAYWDEHPNVFGEACMIVFDTYKKQYWAHHGRTQDDYYKELESEEERYKAFWILPADIEEFWVFAEWCIQKYLHPQANIPQQKTEESYWKGIQLHSFPSEFLSGELKEAEEYRNHTNTLQDYYGGRILRDEEAEEYFFYYGNKHATKGHGFNTGLYFVYQSVVMCPLPTYGEIFYEYYKGIHIVEMVKFLREQTKRMERAEDIQYPAIIEDKHSEEQNSIDDEKQVSRSQENRRKQLTPLLPINRLQHLLNIVLECPSLSKLTLLPDTTEILQHFEWYRPNYSIAFDLFASRYPNEANADKWRKLRRGYEIAYLDFVNEFEQKNDETTSDRLSRMAYLKRSFDKLYSGQSRYRMQDEIATFLRSENFKSLKSQVDADLWDKLDEIGYAVWQSSAYSINIDYMLERALQVEGEPIRDGWLWKEQDAPSPSEMDGSTSHKDSYTLNASTSLSSDNGIQNSPPQSVFINPKKRPTIARQLGLNLNEKNKARLQMLLDLDIPEGKIQTKIDAKVLADYFRQIYHAGDINNIDYKKDEIGDWLAYWFININGKPYQPGSFKYYLQMKDNNRKAIELNGKIRYPKL